MYPHMYLPFGSLILPENQRSLVMIFLQPKENPSAFLVLKVCWWKIIKFYLFERLCFAFLFKWYSFWRQNSELRVFFQHFQDFVPLPSGLYNIWGETYHLGILVSLYIVFFHSDFLCPLHSPSQLHVAKYVMCPLCLTTEVNSKVLKHRKGPSGRLHPERNLQEIQAHQRSPEFGLLNCVNKALWETELLSLTSRRFGHRKWQKGGDICNNPWEVHAHLPKRWLEWTWQAEGTAW